MLRDRVSALSMPLLILGSWSALFWLAQSPFQDFLNHGDWTKAGILASVCGVDLTSLTGTGWIILVTSWLLMVIAMMGPLACIDLNNLQHSRNWAIFGYLIVWLCAGVAFHSVGWVLIALSDAWPWLMFNGWSTAALILLISGLYQLTSMKSRAQMACQTTNNTTASRGTSMMLHGMRYGLQCLKCCWLLMCLMFLFFPGSVLWMLALSLIMFIDRQKMLAVRLSTLVGCIQIALGFGIALTNL